MEQSNNNNDNQLFFTDNESYLKFQNVLIAINEKYPNSINIIEDTHFMELGKVNCGALTSNITITPAGDATVYLEESLNPKKWERHVNGIQTKCHRR